jgi:hypothetical protein
MQGLEYLEETYRTLKQLGVITSQDLYCEEWLSSNRSYIRSMKAKNKEVSPRIIAICAVNLQNKSKELYSEGKNESSTLLDSLYQKGISTLLEVAIQSK